MEGRIDRSRINQEGLVRRKRSHSKRIERELRAELEAFRKERRPPEEDEVRTEPPGNGRNSGVFETPSCNSGGGWRFKKIDLPLFDGTIWTAGSFGRSGSFTSIGSAKKIKWKHRWSPWKETHYFGINGRIRDTLFEGGRS